MTREDLLSALRSLQRPEDAKLSDDDLLYRTAQEYEKEGWIDQFPVLRYEKVRQEAAAEGDRGFFGDMTSAVKRGFAQGRQNFNVYQGATDPTNAQDIAQAEVTIAANPPSRAFQEFQNAPKEDVWGWLKEFAKSPIQITAEAIAESLPASLPSMAAGVIGGAVGGAEALALGPVGGAVGAAVGAGAGSFAVETASKMMDVMREKGMNPADPESVIQFFGDPAKVAEARELGIKRGIPVGIFDGATAGLAGRFMRPLKVAYEAGERIPVGRILGATGKEVGMQAFGGAAGEGLGQVAAGEEFDPRAMFLEGIAEIGSAPSEIRTNLGELRGRPKAPIHPVMGEETPATQLKARVDADVPDVRQFFATPIPEAPAAPPVTAESVAQKIIAGSKEWSPEELAFQQVPENSATVKGILQAEYERQTAGRDPLASEQTKAALRERGVDEDTLHTITEPEAQALLEPARNAEVVEAAAPAVVSPAEQTAVQERKRIADEAEAARVQAEIEAEARAELADAQPEFQGPADQEALAAARSRAAALRGVRIGGQLNFGEETFRDAVRAQVSMSEQRRAMVEQAKAQIKAQRAEAKSPQMALDFTGMAQQPATTASVTPVESAPVQTAPVQAETAVPAGPVAAPFNADHSVVRLLIGSTPLERVKERTTGMVAALAFDPKDQSASLLPLKRDGSGRSLVIVERGEFTKKNDLVDALVREYGERFPGQKGYTKATIKAVVENLAPFTSDGKVNVEQVQRSYKSPEKQAKAIGIAQRALDLGIQKIGNEKYVPLGEYLRERGLTSDFLAITNSPVPSGPQPLVGKMSEILERLAPKQEVKREKSPQLTEKAVLAQQAADSGLPPRRLAGVVDFLKGRSAEEVAALRRLLSENKPQNAELLQAAIDKAVASSETDTAAFKLNLLRAGLEALGKADALERAAKAVAAPALEEKVNPVVSPQPAVQPVVRSRPKVAAEKPASTASPVESPAKRVVTAAPVESTQATKASPVPKEKMSAAGEAALRQLNSVALLDEVTYKVLKSGSLRLPKKLRADSVFLKKYQQLVTEKLQDYEYSRLKKKSGGQEDVSAEIERLTQELKQEKEMEKERERASRGQFEYSEDSFFSPGEDEMDNELIRGDEQYRVQPVGKAEARSNLRNSDNPETYRAQPDGEMVERIVYDMARRGLKVSIAEATNEIKAGGVYSPSTRSVALIIDSISNPDRQAVLSALHEVTHDVLAEAPEEVRAAIHNVIERTPNGRLAFYENPEADPRVATGEGLTPEQLTIERAVEHLALLNVDRDYSRGLLQAVFRSIKDGFLRAAIYLQKLLVGENNTTGKLAEAWVNNELGKVLAGDKQVFDSFLKQFGVKPTFAEVFRMVHDERDRLTALKVDIDNRGVLFLPAAGLDSAVANIDAALEETKRTAQANGTWSAARDAALLKQLFGEDVVVMDDGMRRLAPDYSEYNANQMVQKWLAAAESAQAVANSIHPIIERLYARVKAVQPELTDAVRAALKREGTPAPREISSVEDLYKLLGMVDPRAKAAAAHDHLVGVIETEFQTKLDTQKRPLFDRTVTMDKLEAGPAADLADLSFARDMGKLRSITNRRVDTLRTEITNLEEQEERNRATVRSAMEALGDVKVTRRLLNSSIAEYLRQIGRDLRRTEKLGVAYGQVTGILEALEDETKRSTMSQRYTERLLTGIRFDELPLNAIFKELNEVVRREGMVLTDSDVRSIRQVVIAEVRRNSDSPLSHLVEIGEGPGASDRAKALLSTLINFSKNERFTAEVLQIQMMQGEERARAINQLRAIYKESNERVLSDLKEQTKNLGRPTADFSETGVRPVLTEKAAQELLNARDKALSEQARLARMRRDLAVLESSRSVFNQLVTAADQRLQIGSAFLMADGAHYIDAGTVTDEDAVILEKAKSNRLALAGEKAMTPDQMRDLITRNEEWLDARKSDPTKQGRVYWSLIRQNQEMRRFMHGEKVREFNGGLLHYQMTGIADLFQQTGERAGERIAKAFMQNVGWMRLFAAKGEIEGKKFEMARSKFEKASGAYRETFRDLFYDPASYFMDTFQGSEAEALSELNRRFRENPVTSQYWNKPGAAETFVEVVRSIKRNAALQNEWMETTGANRVEDERVVGEDVFGGDPGSAMERRQLSTGVSGYTRYRFIKDDLKTWASGFRSKLNASGDNNPFAAIKLKVALESSTAQLASDLRTFFDDASWNVFLEPILRNPDGGVPGPVRPDKVRAAVTPRIIEEAMGESGRDLVALADRIYDRVGNKSDAEARQKYRGEFLNWVMARWQFVDRTTAPLVEVGGTQISAPSLGINARTAEFLPQEWLTYPQYTPEDHRKAAHAIVMTGAFGRDMRVLKSGITEIQEGVSARKQELSAEGLSGVTLNDPAWKALKRSDPAKYERLKRVAEYASPPFTKIVGDILNTESDMWTSWHMGRELFGGAVVGMVSGLKTAVKNLVSTSNLFLVQRSASPEVYKTVAGAYAKTGRLFASSVTQLFGVDLLKENPMLQAMVREGAMDAANHTTYRQNLTGERGVNDSITGFARAMRVMRSVFTSTTASPVKGGTAPAIRLLNPFQFTQQLVNMANTWQLLETYYEMAYKASQVYRANPKETRGLTAEDVGMRDKTAFDARRQLLLDNGTSIEELAQKIARGKNPFDAQTIMAVNNISTTLIANEASVVNRPLYITRSKTGQMAGTFVGWGLDQTNRVLKVLETPEGKVNLEAMARGMAVLGLTLLPASLAYAALLDKWDELVEKKQNRRAVTEGPGAWTEAVASVGTFGLVGDLTDYVASMRQGSSGYNDALSLDNRIVFVSSARAMAQGIRNLMSAGVEDSNYVNVMRPMLQAAGAGGILQNAYILDKITGNSLQDLPGVGGVVRMEAGLALRTNMYNYLRAAGREAGLEVRTQQGTSGGYTLTPMSPHITDMVIATLQDDRQEFQAAYRDAIRVAREQGHLDPLKKVQQLFASRHPYRILFNGTPTVAETARMRAVMGEQGAAAVAAGLRQFDTYGASLGIAPFQGSTGLSESQIRRMVVNSRTEPSIGDVFERAMDFRSEDF